MNEETKLTTPALEPGNNMAMSEEDLLNLTHQFMPEIMAAMNIEPIKMGHGILTVPIGPPKNRPMTQEDMMPVPKQFKQNTMENQAEQKVVLSEEDIKLRQWCLTQAFNMNPREIGNPSGFLRSQQITKQEVIKDAEKIFNWINGNGFTIPSSKTS